MNVSEVAKIFGKTTRSIHSWCEQGKMSYTWAKTTRRDRRDISVSAILDFITSYGKPKSFSQELFAEKIAEINTKKNQEKENNPRETKPKPPAKPSKPKARKKPKKKKPPVVAKKEFERVMVVGGQQSLSPVALKFAVEFEKLTKMQRENLIQEGKLSNTENIRETLKTSLHKHYSGLILELVELVDTWCLKLNLGPVELSKMQRELKATVKSAWSKIRYELNRSVKL